MASDSKKTAVKKTASKTSPTPVTKAVAKPQTDAKPQTESKPATALAVLGALAAIFFLKRPVEAGGGIQVSPRIYEVF